MHEPVVKTEIASRRAALPTKAVFCTVMFLQYIIPQQSIWQKNIIRVDAGHSNIVGCHNQHTAVSPIEDVPPCVNNISSIINVECTKINTSLDIAYNTSSTQSAQAATF
mmetsp:Transcript_16829/g.26252  ORF Transcript_16829/g.26252 Transcript_16829/m.26252 type:complete len:109 (+) Transcript_16829:83-409(+)